MKIVQVKHALLKQADGSPVVVGVDLTLIPFWYFSPSSNSTHLVASGGAIVPVLESADEIKKLKQE